MSCNNLCSENTQSDNVSYVGPNLPGSGANLWWFTLAIVRQ
jgi:hypothetical protein